MRQFMRHLEDFFGGISTAFCIWQSLVRLFLPEEYSTSFSENRLPEMPCYALLGLTVDTRLRALCIRQSLVGCLVPGEYSSWIFLGDDSCHGLLVAGLWVPTTTF